MNLTGFTYAFNSSGISICMLWGLVRYHRIKRENITGVRVERRRWNLRTLLLKPFTGIHYGNRFTTTVLVVETNLFWLPRLFLTPKDPREAIARLYPDKPDFVRAHTPFRPALRRTVASKRRLC